MAQSTPIPAGAAPYLDLLRRYHADATPHSGRALIDHLAGVYRLLEAWNNAPEICRAGLFHSIYGTNIFTVRSASFDDRAHIRAVIGDVAERLAFLFCVSERPVAFLKAALERNYILADVVHGGEVPVTEAELNALIEIEVANFLEQPEEPEDIRLIHRTIASIEVAGPVLTKPARAALAAYLDGAAPNQSSSI
jgi:hypothetical protein